MTMIAGVDLNSTVFIPNTFLKCRIAPCLPSYGQQQLPQAHWMKILPAEDLFPLCPVWKLPGDRTVELSCRELSLMWSWQAHIDGLFVVPARCCLTYRWCSSGSKTLGESRTEEAPHPLSIFSHHMRPLCCYARKAWLVPQFFRV